MINKNVSVVFLTLVSILTIQLNAQNNILNNQRIRVGNGAENSINTSGNMQQPFYYNGDNAAWYKLTYSSYPLDIRWGIGGDGTNNWNISGAMVNNPTWSNQVYDYSNFTVTNPVTGDGYGTIVTTGNITIDGKHFLVENTFTLPQPDGYIQINVKLTNQSGASVDNVRLWVGTRDDWVGATDSPTKTRGNLIDGSFVPIGSMGVQAKAIKVSTGTEAIMFYSNSSRAQTTISSCCSFTNATNTNPSYNVVSTTGDGSYAMYVRFNDLANGESDELEWFYAAGTLAEIDDIINAVASASGSVDNITQTTADFTYETSETGTTYYIVVQDGSTTPTEAQIKAGVDYSGVTMVTSGNSSTTANIEHVFNLTGFTANTSYTVYAVTEYNDGDSDVFSTIANASFTTLAAAPTVTITTVTNITSTTGSSGGNVTSDGGASVTARGICWSTSSGPTIADDKTTDGTGTGSYTSSITGLSANTTYYARAYATNSIGTSYSNEESFSTPTLPIVTTTAATSITSTTASSGGNVTSDGGASVSARGVCWSTSSGPTITDDKTTDGTGTGSFTSSITGLSAGNTYYSRAYAINSVGTSYGNEEIFSTATPEINLKQSTTSIIDSGSHDFGGSILGTNNDIVFTIENTGTANLTLTTPLIIGGTDASQFSILSQPTSPVTASGSTTFTVRFTPATIGSKSANISIANNDSNENPYDLILNGTGIFGTVMISGKIKWSSTNAPMEDITITFSNSGGKIVKTDVNGYYEVHLNAPYTGEAIPKSTNMYGAGVDYYPVQYSYTNTSAKQENQNFFGSPQYAKISGYLKDDSGMPIEGFNIVFDNGGETVSTNSSGYYESFVKVGWSGTVTPSKVGWTCNPENINYTNICANCEDQNFVGQVIALSAEEDFSNVPKSFTVLPAYPNPFNPSTTITYGLEDNSNVTISIYNLSGSLITTLLNTKQTQGWHTIEWNGTDQHNNQVPAGIYLSRITSNNTTKTSKLMLLK